MSDDFEDEILKFAKALNQKASKDDTPLEEATSAFKALTTFYAILRKHPKDDAGNGVTTFESLQDDVHRVVREESENNGAEAPVRSRHRRNGAAPGAAPATGE